MNRHPNILNAASNLLGVCFILITGLKISGRNGASWADEAAWLAAFLLLSACLLSYLTIRHPELHDRAGRLADGCFIGGILTLAGAVAIAAIFL